MKRYISILMTLAAALGLASCNVAEIPEVQPGVLTITLDSGTMVTKSADTAFETAIDHFDFFFFEDEDGTIPIAGMHGRATGSSKVLNTNTGEEFAALRNITSYVYVVANYPMAIDHSTDMTLSDVRNLRFSSPLARSSSGEVTLASTLVMDSYNAGTQKYTFELTPTAYQEERNVTVPLQRIASKFTMEIHVPKKLEAKDGGYWTPMKDNIQAYFLNAYNVGTTVNAKPEPVPGQEGSELLVKTRYFDYPATYPVANIGETENEFVYLTDPAYTYPQTWNSGDNGEPYFKIFMPWKHNVSGSSNFYYKVVAPKAVSGVCTIDRNTWYQLVVKLSVVDTADEYIELDYGITVVPWADPGFIVVPEGSVAHFFNVPNEEYDIYSQEELSIPFSSSSAVSAYFTEIEYKHYKDGAGKTYTFTFDDETTNLFTVPEQYDGADFNPAIARDQNQYKLTVEGKNVKFEHALTNVYTVRTVQLVIKNEEGDLAVVTINQHPAIEVKSRDAGTVFVNGHFARALESVHVNGDASKKMGVPFELHFNPGQGETRYHSDDTDFDLHAESVADVSQNRTYWFDGGSETYAGTESASPNIIRNVNYGRYGFIEGDVKRESALYMAEVIVSAFDGTNNTYTINEDGSSHSKTYVLGDPRVAAGPRFDIFKITPDRKINDYSHFRQGGGYLFQSSTVRNSDGTTTVGDAIYKAWDQPEKIMISSTDKLDGGFIAPHFIISSFFNAQPGSLNHEDCLKRAATYQEAGFPAGRWRLPTEAEIMFIVQQQQQGVLPRIYAPGSSYWCADGRYVTIASSGSTVYFKNPASTSETHVNRFVYDLWYWGDEPMSDSETYWANMHLVTPNED